MTATDTPLGVGFVGLGKMGHPMARNLAAAGFGLVVRDADSGAQTSFATQHSCVSASAPTDFSEVAAVVTMLPDDRSVREAVLEWEGGIAAALVAGSVVVDMSSSDPRGTTALGQELATRGIALIDAPVSGGVPRAENGTLTLMIGSDDDEALEKVRGLLEVMGERLFRTGPLGSGHAMKALNNFVGGGTYALVAEALEVGQHFGLKPETMIEVMNASTARSFNTENVFEPHVVTGEYATGFALGLLAKDVGIAGDLADAASVDAPLAQVVRGRWATAAEDLGFSADHSLAHTSWWGGSKR
jgi:3-hydroxyisobutyrate dehydrogenase